MKSIYGLDSFLSAIFLTVLSISAGHAQATPPRDQMKAMLVSVKKGMGKLLPAQDRVFQEEVLLQPDFFLKNVRQEQQKVFADVDEDGVHAFLTFPQGTALLEIKIDPTCVSCKKSEEEVRKTAEASLVRRGLKVVASLEGGEGGAVLKTSIQIGYSAPDLSDTGHADEKLLNVKVTQKWAPDVEDVQNLSLNENSPISSNFQKVWNASLSSLGMKSYRLKQSAQLKNSQEYFVKIHPLREYAVLERFLSGLREKYAESHPFRLARGAGTIRVRGAEKREELIEYLRGLRLESGKISKVLPAPDSENGVEVKIE